MKKTEIKKVIIEVIDRPSCYRTRLIVDGIYSEWTSGIMDTIMSLLIEGHNYTFDTKGYGSLKVDGVQYDNWTTINFDESKA